MHLYILLLANMSYMSLFFIFEIIYKKCLKDLKKAEPTDGHCL